MCASIAIIVWSVTGILVLKILVPNILVSQTDCFGPPKCLVALNLHYPMAST